MKIHSSKSATFPVLLVLFAAALLGAATPASKALRGSLSVFPLTGLLYLGAAIGVTVELIQERSWRTSTKMDCPNRKRTATTVRPACTDRCSNGLSGTLFLVTRQPASAKLLKYRCLFKKSQAAYCLPQ